MALGLGFAPGCESDDNNGTGGTGGTGGSTGGTGGSTGGTGGSTGGTGGSTGGTGGSTGGTGGSTGGTGGTGGAVTVYADVKPIFMAKCGMCHAGTGSGSTAHKLAESADDAKKASYTGACMGKPKGECSLIRVKAGTMPFGKGCTGNPANDASKPDCLTQEEQDKLQAWITGGLM
jgi:hypothetical protein